MRIYIVTTTVINTKQCISLEMMCIIIPSNMYLNEVDMYLHNIQLNVNVKIIYHRFV